MLYWQGDLNIWYGSNTDLYISQTAHYGVFLAIINEQNVGSPGPYKSAVYYYDLEDYNNQHGPQICNIDKFTIPLT